MARVLNSLNENDLKQEQTPATVKDLTDKHSNKITSFVQIFRTHTRVYRVLRLDNKKTKILLIFLTIIAVVAIGLILINKRQQMVTRQNQAKILYLLKTFDCSNSAMNSVAQYVPNPKLPTDSMYLLNYRSSCDIKNQQYKKALAVLNQEKTYCTYLKESACTYDIQKFIDGVTNTLNSTSINTINKG